MKQRRRPTRRKPSQQPRKRLPPTSTDKLPPLDWLTVEQPIPPRVRARNPALMSSGVVQPPLPPRRASNAVLDPIGAPNGPLTLRADAAVGVQVEKTVIRAAPHKEMLSWIEVLEFLIAELPKQQRSIGHNIRPITGDDVQEITQAVAILKSQPVVPTAPDEARAAGSTLMRFGERLGSYLLKQGDIFVSEAVKSAGKEAGKRLVQSPFWWALATTLMILAQSVQAWLR